MILKVKIFSSNNTEELENNINTWLDNHNIDIIASNVSVTMNEFGSIMVYQITYKHK